MNERIIWLLPVPILLITALICWLLGRRVPTRRLGIGAALATLVAFACLVIASRLSVLPLEMGNRDWITAFSTAPEPVAQATLNARVDGLTVLFAGATLLGGCVGLLYLAQSLGGSLVGYGRLWAALLLMLVGVLVGVLAGDWLVLAFGWGVALLGGAMARQVVGGDDQRPLAALGIAALSGFALLTAILGFALRPNDPTSGSYAFADIDASLHVTTWLPLLLASIIALGLPPFGRMLSDDEGTPPALHGLIIACGVPLLAIYTLLRVVGLTFGTWPVAWFHTLTIVGTLGLIAGAAHALQARRFGPLVGWQAVAQWGLTLVVLGQYNPRSALGDPTNALVLLTTLTLALSSIWTTLTGACALGALEQRTGSDQIGGQPRLRAPLRAAGLVYALSALTVVGIPPLLGFWTRRWLLTALASSPLVLLILIAGSGLLALSYLGPLTTFWRIDPAQRSNDSNESAWANTPVLLVSAIPVVVFSLAPNVLLQTALLSALGALQPLAKATAMLEASYLTPSTQLLIAGMLGLLIIGAMRTRATQPMAIWTGGEALDHEEGTPHAPQAIGYSLRGLALLANPHRVLSTVGTSLEWLSDRVSWVFQVFSGRYYLTGVLIAALTLILLLVQ